MNQNGKEIERKFMIAYPDADVLSRCHSRSEIVQTYLLRTGQGRSSRVRRRTSGSDTVYTHTEKQHVTDMTRIEIERIISEKEYGELLKNADPERNVIYKTRYCLDYKGQEFEIDIFPFWNDKAVMELELEEENQTIEFPPCVQVLRELTGDKRYTNAALAKCIPEE